MTPRAGHRAISLQALPGLSSHQGSQALVVIEIDPTSLLVGRCQAFICDLVPVVVLTRQGWQTVLDRKEVRHWDLSYYTWEGAVIDREGAVVF